MSDESEPIVEWTFWGFDRKRHVVAVHADEWGRPKYITNDGAQVPIRFPVKLDVRRVEERFEVGGMTAAVILEKRRAEGAAAAWFRRFRAAFAAGLVDRLRFGYFEASRAAARAYAADPFTIEMTLVWTTDAGERHRTFRADGTPADN